MIEEILERIAKALEEHNEINKKGWERNALLAERYLALNPLPKDTNPSTFETQPTREHEDVVAQIAAAHVQMKEGFCSCGHDYRTHGIQGCFVLLNGNYCDCIIQQPDENKDYDRVNAVSTHKPEPTNDPA